MADPLTVESFRPAVGEAFTIDGGPDLVLEEAVGHGRAFQDREAFTLRFRGPADRALGQATYRVTHPAVGPQDIFIVPVGHDGDGMRYEAIFT